MKGTHLGEFEELVLLTIAALTTSAYSVAICEELEKHTGRKIRLGVVHAVLNRLEGKGFLNSCLGEPTNERGGRRKRFYELTNAGKAALLKAKELRDGLWAIIPDVVFKGWNG
ncbi:MAG: helix-turn-helix transcriptional regulator [Saprospiraceae bacterium]